MTQTGGGTALISCPSIFHCSREAECDNQCSPAAQAQGLQKPQAHNECHTIVTTCTFMERGRKDVSGEDALTCDETSTVNQTIKERAERHVRNGSQKPRLIYSHDQKRAVPCNCARNLSAAGEKSLSKRDRNIWKWCIRRAFLHAVPLLCCTKSAARYPWTTPSAPNIRRLEVFQLGHYLLFLASLSLTSHVT